MTALDRDAALAAIIACAPRGMELDPVTGNERREEAAYVEGVRAAYDAVAAL